MNAYEREIGDAALRSFGRVGNILKAVEELAELQRALCRHLAAPTDEATLANVHEEMADVQIMLNRLLTLFDAAEVADWKESKLERLARMVGVEIGEEGEEGAAHPEDPVD